MKMPKGFLGPRGGGAVFWPLPRRTIERPAMRQGPVWLAAVSALAGAARHADGWHVVARFLNRSSLIDDFPEFPLYLSSGASATMRVQIALFDDDNGPAPDGGLVGWTTGTLDAGGTNGSSSR